MHAYLHIPAKEICDLTLYTRILLYLRVSLHPVRYSHLVVHYRCLDRQLKIEAKAVLILASLDA